MRALLVVWVLILSGGTLPVAAGTPSVDPPPPTAEPPSDAGIPPMLNVPPGDPVVREWSEEIADYNNYLADGPGSRITGTEKVVVLRIQFNDTPPLGSHTQPFYENLILNQTPASKSMWVYYNETSYGTYGFTGVVQSNWTVAKYNESRYGTYELSGSPPLNYNNSQDMVLEAIEGADALINYSNYDSNADGKVDHLIVVHSGIADEADGDGTGPSGDPQMWSHRWGLNLKQVKRDGVWLNAFTVQAEGSPMGVFAHEFGHDLGLPDLYDTDYTSDGVGKWDIMGMGGNLDSGKTPCQFSAWSKIRLGWVTPTVLLATQLGVSLPRIETSATAYKVWAKEPTEYFLIENRQLTGFDAFLPGAGMLIWHIDDSMPGNTNESHKLIDVEEAHGGVQHLDTYGGDQGGAGDTWKSTGVGGFTPSSDPNSKNYSNGDTTVSVTNVSASGTTMTFDFYLTNTPPTIPVLTGPTDALETNDATPTFTLWSDDVNLDLLRYKIEISNDGFASVYRTYDQSINITGWSAASYAPKAVGSFTVPGGEPLPDGTYQWRARAWDGTNWSGLSPVRTFTVDTVLPIASSVSINAGATWATGTAVTLTLTASDERSGLSQMQFSNDGVAWSAWEAWAGTKAWTLTAGDGVKIVSFRVRDDAGNVALTITDGITLDGTAPGGVSILINSGNFTTRVKGVNLALTGFDATSGLDVMSFSENGGAWTAWEPFAVSRAWNLSATGVRTVTFRVRDLAGNINTGQNDAIIYDTAPPAGLSVVVNGGIAAVSFRDVNLTLAANDPLSGVHSMRFSHDGVIWTNWTPYVNASAWTLENLQGIRRVYFQVNDTAGNVAQPALGIVVYDVTAPSQLVLALAGGGTATNTSPADFTIGAVDVHSGLALMRFKIAGSSWSAWFAYNTSPTVGLGLAGPKVLHVQVQDAAGNIAETTLALVYDTAPPAPVLGTASGITADRWVTLAIDGGDLESGPVLLRITVNGLAGPWEPFVLARALLLPDLDGAHTIRVEVIDAAGNTGAAQITVTLDRVAPAITAVTPGTGTGWADDIALLVTVTATDAVTGAAFVRWSVDGVVWSAWAPFTGAAFQAVLIDRDGPQAVYIQVMDRAGNVAGPAVARLTLDRLDPVVVVEVNGGSDLSTNGTVRIAFDPSADPTPAALELSLSPDGVFWTPWGPLPAAANWTLGGSGPSRPLSLRIRDPAGNTLQVDRTIMIDDVVPAVPAQFLEGTVTASREVHLVLLADPSYDGVAYRTSLWPGIYSDWLAVDAITTLLLPDSDGVHILHVEVLDGAGNLGSGTATIRLDRKGPSPVVVDAGPAAVGKRDLQVLVTADDPSGPLEVSLSEDGIAWTDWVELTGVRILYTLSGAEGAIVLYARVRDAAGNIGGPGRDIVTLDATGPTILRVTPADGSTVATPDVTLTITALADASGVADVAVSYDDGRTWDPWGRFDGTVEITLDPPGLYALAVRLRDSSGNVGEHFPLSIAYSPAEAYVIAFSGPGPGSVQQENVRIAGTVTGDGVAEVEVRIDGGPWQRAVGTSSWAYTWDSTKATDGSHTVEVRAGDGYGHALGPSLSFVTENVQDPGTPTPSQFGLNFSDPSFLMMFLILVIVAVGAGIGGAAAFRPRTPPPPRSRARDEGSAPSDGVLGPSKAKWVRSRRETSCATCGRAISISEQVLRCSCSAMYHGTCSSETSQCGVCGVTLET